MRIYLYNSYKGSPVGFVMGMIAQRADGSLTDLMKSDIPDAVRACFEHGIIKNVLGNINVFNQNGELPSYLLLLKNLTCSGAGLDDDFTWYLNIALETTDMTDMEKWLESAEEKNTACLISQCFEVDKNNEFGYQVISDKLIKLLKTSFVSSVIPPNVKAAFNKGCWFNFSPKLPKTEQGKFLAQYFGASSKSITLSDGDWTLAEKKSPKKVSFFPIATILFAIMLGGGLWVMQEETPPETPQGKVEQILMHSKSEFNLSSNSLAILLNPKKKNNAVLKLLPHCLPPDLKTKRKVEVEILFPALSTTAPGIIIVNENEVENIANLITAIDNISCSRQSAKTDIANDKNCSNFIFCHISFINNEMILPLIIDENSLSDDVKNKYNFNNTENELNKN